MRRCLLHIESLEPQVRAFVELQADQALEAARLADGVPLAERGLLHGLPVAVKAVFDVAGMRCNWGSKIHQDRVPETDAPLVRLLKQAGAIVVGTTVSTEYAIAAAGQTNNPFDVARTPGGSSSGSAAAVACGMVPFAVGSQTVGSIVRPAVYCGIYGMKPTHGAIPKRGGMTLSPRLDHPGLLARTPEDIGLLCQVLFSHDDADPRSQRILPPAELPAWEGTRVLTVRQWPPGPISEVSASALAQAERSLAKAGAIIEPIELPASYPSVLDVLYTIMTHDMALAHGDDRDRAGDDMTAPLRELIDKGRRVSEGEYDQAVQTAATWKQDLGDLLGDGTVMVSAATQNVAPLKTEGTGSNALQALWSLVGFPVMAVPTGQQDRLPIGVQIGAGAGQEGAILSAAISMQDGE